MRIDPEQQRRRFVMSTLRGELTRVIEERFAGDEMADYEVIAVLAEMLNDMCGRYVKKQDDGWS